jgi:TolB-like protein/DNA-binding winged helix-turn-helix (wHTH) protein/Tfp pilus assembly protein PilF
VGDAFQIGPWLAQPGLNAVSQDGRVFRLEPKVMEVLVCLAGQAGETVSKEKLIQSVWPDTFVTDDVLTHSISELRKVFEDHAKEPRFIQTIPKRGYRLIASVQPVHGDVAKATRTEAPVETAGPVEGKRSVTNRRLRIGLLMVPVVFAAVLAFALVRNRLVGRVAAAQIHSIAVLPLQNLSNDPNQEYFSDGLTDALITDLAQVSSLKVISRTSIMSYKNTQKPLPEIARELKVDGIVEGTVQRSGDRVRITVQLVHGPTDIHLWARSYERDLRNVLTLEAEAAKSVAEEIQARLTPQEKARLAEPRSANLQSLEAYLQGEHHLNNYGKGYDAGELKRAAEYFQQAINQDTSFAPAYIKLGETYDWEGEMLRPSEVMPREKAVAEKALSLDPNLSDAHLALARVSFQYEWDWVTAERELRKALELNPNNANAHEVLGDYLEAMGHLNEGLDEQQRAEELDPHADPDHLSNGFYRNRQYDRGIAWLRKQIEINPREGVHYVQLAGFYAEKGMQAEYIESFAKSLTLYGFPQLAESLRRNYATAGYAKALRELCAETEKLQERGTLWVPGILADTYTRIGDKEKAIYWLQISLQERDYTMFYLNCDPQWDSLRSDPRFKDLVRRVGLPQ